MNYCGRSFGVCLVKSDRYGVEDVRIALHSSSVNTDSHQYLTAAFNGETYNGRSPSRPMRRCFDCARLAAFMP